MRILLRQLVSQPSQATKDRPRQLGIFDDRRHRHQALNAQARAGPRWLPQQPGASAGEKPALLSSPETFTSRRMGRNCPSGTAWLKRPASLTVSTECTREAHGRTSAAFRLCKWPIMCHQPAGCGSPTLIRLRQRRHCRSLWPGLFDPILAEKGQPARYAAATVSAPCVLLTATSVTWPGRPARCFGDGDTFVHPRDVVSQCLFVHVTLAASSMRRSVLFGLCRLGRRRIRPCGRRCRSRQPPRGARRHRSASVGSPTKGRNACARSRCAARGPRARRRPPARCGYDLISNLVAARADTWPDPRDQLGRLAAKGLDHRSHGGRHRTGYRARAIRCGRPRTRDGVGRTAGPACSRRSASRTGTSALVRQQRVGVRQDVAALLGANAHCDSPCGVDSG